jgi:hypothetical protein
MTEGTFEGGLPVLLTAFWGFSPETWGCIGFTSETDQRRFMQRYSERCYVAVYVTKSVKSPFAGRVAGIYELGRRTGKRDDFVELTSRHTGINSGKWLHSIKATRAWAFVDPLNVEEAAPRTYTTGRARHLGARGDWLKPDEIESLLSREVIERHVFGGDIIPATPPEPLAIAIRPSKAGPVSQSPFLVQEAEGPKHLYVLQMTGEVCHMLGCQREDVAGKSIVKVGFSWQPESRRLAFMKALPYGAFSWQVAKQTSIPVPNSTIARRGEDAIKAHLDQNGRSLGGEFFLAEPGAVEDAWQAGLGSAQ